MVELLVGFVVWIVLGVGGAYLICTLEEVFGL